MKPERRGNYHRRNDAQGGALIKRADACRRTVIVLCHIHVKKSNTYCILQGVGYVSCAGLSIRFPEAP